MSIKIIKAGILDTIQDTGRYGYQHMGINPNGAMDRFSAQLANALLGKELHAAVFEFHFPAPVIFFEEDAMISITGGNFSPMINEKEGVMNAAVTISKLTTLSFKRPIEGARCYLSIYPEIKIEKWLHSYSTNLKAAAGGWKGRQLKAGDQIFFTKSMKHNDQLSVSLQPEIVGDISQNRPTRVIPGAAWENLSEPYREIFFNHHFTITKLADRMGYRLAGTPLQLSTNNELLSTAVTFGTIQMLPDGQLIVLMADHQTTGGYSQIAHVITSDVSAIGQKQPGEQIRFSLTNLDIAEKELRSQIRYLEELSQQTRSYLQNIIDAKN